MTSDAPAAIAALKGTSSTESSRAELRAHDRQSDVRVDVGVAVPGKVLRRRELAAVLRAANEERRESRDALRILAERSRVDDRVRRIVVHVDDRREVDVNADRSPLLRDRATDVVRVRVARRRGDRHRRREHRRAAGLEQIVREQPALEPAEPGLEVRAHEQRHARAALQIVQLGGDFDRRAQRHRHAADAVLLHPPDDLRRSVVSRVLV